MKVEQSISFSPWPEYPDGIIFDHASFNINMAYKSFTDFQLDGEQLWPKLKPGLKNVKGVMDVDFYRAHMMGYNHGRVGVWDPKLGNQPHTTREAQRRTGPSIAQHIQSIALLHDSGHHMWNNPPDEHRAPAENALERLNWGSQYLTIPYWDQEVVVMPQNMYATFYVEPGPNNPKPDPVDTTGHYCLGLDNPPAKVICIFSNESDWQGEMRLRLNWSILGFDSTDGLAVENAVHRFKLHYLEGEQADLSRNDVKWELVEDPEEYARIENGELVFPMTDGNYRMIVLQ